MNKKIKTYFESLGLSIQGNNAYGTIRGYEVSANVAMLDTVSPIKIHVNFYMPIQVKVQMASEIRALAYKHFVIDLDMYGVSLGFNDPLTVGKLLNRMPDMMNNIFNHNNVVLLYHIIYFYIIPHYFHRLYNIR